jgi:hypothetical protein
MTTDYEDEHLCTCAAWNPSECICGAWDDVPYYNDYYDDYNEENDLLNLNSKGLTDDVRKTIL